MSNNRMAINLSKLGLSYPQLMTLTDLGLIHKQEIESQAYPQDSVIKLNNHGKVLNFTTNSKDVILTYYKFTQTGDELRKLINMPVSKGYKQLLSSALDEEFDVTWHTLKK